jgi:hypothetical protein
VDDPQQIDAFVAPAFAAAEDLRQAVKRGRMDAGRQRCFSRGSISDRTISDR